MSRNILYLVIGALAVVTVVLSYQFYQERQKTTGVEISVSERGISIEKKLVPRLPVRPPTNVS